MESITLYYFLTAESLIYPTQRTFKELLLLK